MDGEIYFRHRGTWLATSHGWFGGLSFKASDALIKEKKRKMIPVQATVRTRPQMRSDRWVHFFELWSSACGGSVWGVRSISLRAADGERDEWCLLQPGRLCCGSRSGRYLPGGWRESSDCGFLCIAWWPACVELPCLLLNRLRFPKTEDFHSVWGGMGERWGASQEGAILTSVVLGSQLIDVGPLHFKPGDHHFHPFFASEGFLCLLEPSQTCGHAGVSEPEHQSSVRRARNHNTSAIFYHRGWLLMQRNSSSVAAQNN